MLNEQHFQCTLAANTNILSLSDYPPDDFPPFCPFDYLPKHYLNWFCCISYNWMTTLNIFFPLWSRRMHKTCHVERPSDNPDAFAYTQSAPQMLKFISKLIPCNFCLLSGDFSSLLASYSLPQLCINTRYKKKKEHIQTGNSIYTITVVNRCFLWPKVHLWWILRAGGSKGRNLSSPSALPSSSRGLNFCS